jgi:hypothetical protein
MKNCPVCGRGDASHAQAEGLWERVVLRLMGYRPYRCSFCRTRFRAFGFFNGASASRLSKKNGAVENPRPEESFPEFLPTEDKKEFRELIEEIRQAENRVNEPRENQGNEQEEPGVRSIEELMPGVKQQDSHPGKRANAVFGPGRAWHQKR